MKTIGILAVVAVMISTGLGTASLVDKAQASIGAAITYTTTYANPADTPIWGTMIDPSSYYLGDTDSGAAAKAGGNALDTKRVFMYDWNPTTVFQMMKWDMGFATDFVRVYPNVEHDGGLDWDYLQWSLWGSNTGAENPGAWTLLWDPLSTSGSDVNSFVVTSWNGIEPTTIYRYGSSLGADAWDDAFTIDFNLPTTYRYFGVRVSTLALNAGPADPEVDAVAGVPPAPTPPPAVGGVVELRRGTSALSAHQPGTSAPPYAAIAGGLAAAALVALTAGAWYPRRRRGR